MLPSGLSKAEYIGRQFVEDFRKVLGLVEIAFHVEVHEHFQSLG
jgi:hypothetical protein